MHKLIIIAVLALTLASCQEKLEEKAARDAETFTLKNCPLRYDENLTLDSMTFTAPTLTLSYYYTLGAALENPALDKSSMRSSLLESLRNATNLKAYKDKGYNFRYVYHAATKPDSVVIEMKFTKQDYAQ